jgi:hypothetical protein
MPLALRDFFASDSVVNRNPLRHCTEICLNFYLEPILSTNTDEFYAVLSGPFKDEGKDSDHKIVVEALTTRPLSLVDPVLPPGYRFAVIDRDCNVMFHSDSFRNLRENLCDEFRLSQHTSGAS